MTPDTAHTLGQTVIQLQGLVCDVQVVPNTFLIDNAGIIGWDVIDRHQGCLGAANKCLKLGNTSISFESNEKITTPPRVKMVISARARDNDVEVGWVSLMDLHSNLLFGILLRKIEMAACL